MQGMAFPLSWEFPYAWPRTPILARNMVCTTQPLAAQAGLAMLADGGNAVDAALATAITLTLVEPVSNGIGSDTFAIIWDGRKLHGLNASGHSPASWTPEFFAGRDVPGRGWNSVTVPGAVSSWVEMHDKFGRIPFERLFEPAIDYGRGGFPVSPMIARQWAAQVPELQAEPGFADAFLVDGRAPHPGEVFRLPEHATTLEAIATTKGEAFYCGQLAEVMETHSLANGGAMLGSDLAAHRPEWVNTMAQSYRGYTVHQIPPNGQGIIALMALGILEHFDIASLPVDSAESVHLQIEAVKLAFADALAYVADARYMRCDPQQLLDREYLKQRSQLIDRRRAQQFTAGKPATGGTVYLSVADSAGMMVSMIQSNFKGFGSGVVVPGTGISLHNRGASFVAKEGHPNQVGPNKRPYHTVLPGFVTKGGAPVMSFGVMGANMQPQGHVQILVRIADYAQNPQTACDGPRFRWIQGMEVGVERGFSAATVGGLRVRGHQMVPVDDYNSFGSCQAIWRLDDGYLGASDPRRDGQAVGF